MLRAVSTLETRRSPRVSTRKKRMGSPSVFCTFWGPQK